MISTMKISRESGTRESLYNSFQKGSSTVNTSSGRPRRRSSSILKSKAYEPYEGRWRSRRVSFANRIEVKEFANPSDSSTGSSTENTTPQNHKRQSDPASVVQVSTPIESKPKPRCLAEDKSGISRLSIIPKCDTNYIDDSEDFEPYADPSPDVAKGREEKIGTKDASLRRMEQETVTEMDMELTQQTEEIHPAPCPPTAANTFADPSPDVANGEKISTKDASLRRMEQETVTEMDMELTLQTEEIHPAPCPPAAANTFADPSPDVANGDKISTKDASLRRMEQETVTAMDMELTLQTEEIHPAPCPPAAANTFADPSPDVTNGEKISTKDATLRRMEQETLSESVDMELTLTDNSQTEEIHPAPCPPAAANPLVLPSQGSSSVAPRRVVATSAPLSNHPRPSIPNEIAELEKLPGTARSQPNMAQFPNMALFRKRRKSPRFVHVPRTMATRRTPLKVPSSERGAANLDSAPVDRNSLLVSAAPTDMPIDRNTSLVSTASANLPVDRNASLVSIVPANLDIEPVDRNASLSAASTSQPVGRNASLVSAASTSQLVDRNVSLSAASTSQPVGRNASLVSAASTSQPVDRNVSLSAASTSKLVDRNVSLVSAASTSLPVDRNVLLVSAASTSQPVGRNASLVSAASTSQPVDRNVSLVSAASTSQLVDRNVSLVSAASINQPVDRNASLVSAASTSQLVDRNVSLVSAASTSHPVDRNASLSAASTSQLVDRNASLVSTVSTSQPVDRNALLISAASTSHLVDRNVSLSAASTSQLVDRNASLVSAVSTSQPVDRNASLVSAASTSHPVDRNASLSAASTSQLVDRNASLVSGVSTSQPVDRNVSIVSAASTSQLVDRNVSLVSSASTSQLVDRNVSLVSASSTSQPVDRNTSLFSTISDISTSMHIAPVDRNTSVVSAASTSQMIPVDRNASLVSAASTSQLVDRNVSLVSAASTSQMIPVDRNVSLVSAAPTYLDIAPVDRNTSLFSTTSTSMHSAPVDRNTSVVSTASTSQNMIPVDRNASLVSTAPTTLDFAPVDRNASYVSTVSTNLPVDRNASPVSTVPTNLGIASADRHASLVSTASPKRSIGSVGRNASFVSTASTYLNIAPVDGPVNRNTSLSTASSNPDTTAPMDTNTSLVSTRRAKASKQPLPDSKNESVEIQTPKRAKALKRPRSASSKIITRPTIGEDTFFSHVHYLRSRFLSIASSCFERLNNPNYVSGHPDFKEFLEVVINRANMGQSLLTLLVEYGRLVRLSNNTVPVPVVSEVAINEVGPLESFEWIKKMIFEVQQKWSDIEAALVSASDLYHWQVDLWSGSTVKVTIYNSARVTFTIDGGHLNSYPQRIVDIKVSYVRGSLLSSIPPLKSYSTTSEIAQLIWTVIKQKQ